MSHPETHPRPDLMAMAVAERRELADLLAELSPAEWVAPSWCVGWRVRDVVSHMISYESLRPHSMIKLALRARVNPDRMNQLLVDDRNHLTTADLLAEVRAAEVPRGLTAGFGGMIALVDGMIHQQDIRRPLDRPRIIPAARIRATMDRAVTAPLIKAKRRLAALRLVADDLNWSHGDGAEVTGPAEALLLAIAGRRQVWADLSGPGLALLQRRDS